MEIHTSKTINKKPKEPRHILSVFLEFEITHSSQSFLCWYSTFTPLSSSSSTDIDVNGVVHRAKGDINEVAVSGESSIWCALGPLSPLCELIPSDSSPMLS
ncbi:hypothetical protein I7I48_07842 [Histoplasma ohiense]|nr:hypothetical protein I7I48_07842 [Histoplasma ohiense (nom. inval.)]